MLPTPSPAVSEVVNIRREERKEEMRSPSSSHWCLHPSRWTSGPVRFASQKAYVQFA